MEDKIVLLCCTGRSGSTTLQRIINTIPNSNICGENWGAVNNLLAFYENIKKSSNNNIPGKMNPLNYDNLIKMKIKPAFYNSYDFDTIKNQLKLLIISMFKKDNNTKLWGFKEIRYDNKIHLIKTFKELFPQTKIILHYSKDIDKQSKSGWWFNNKNSSTHLTNYTNELIKFHQENDFTYLSEMENMLNGNVYDIFKFIGCEQYYDKKKIDEILKDSFEH